MAKGYTKIENNLFDSMLKYDLTPAEFKVSMFLLRYTKGFNRETTRASYTYISFGTNLSVETVKRCIKSLIKKGLVDIAYEHKGSAAQVVKFMYIKMTTSCGQKSPHDGGKNDHINGGKNDHQDIKEDIKDIHKRKERLSPNFTTKTWEELNQEDFDD